MPALLPRRLAFAAPAALVAGSVPALAAQDAADRRAALLTFSPASLRQQAADLRQKGYAERAAEYEALAAGHPDAALFAACEEHARLWAEDRRLLAAFRAVDGADPSAVEAAADAWNDAGEAAINALDRVIALPARTMDGAIAKAERVETWRDLMRRPDAERSYTDRAVDSLMADLLRLGAVAA